MKIKKKHLLLPLLLKKGEKQYAVFHNFFYMFFFTNIPNDNSYISTFLTLN